MSCVAAFEIEYVQYMDESGQALADLPNWATEVESLEHAYKWMLLTRLFDAKAVALQRTGQMGTYASCLGQEAIGAAIGLAMHPNDVFVPSYRETGAQLIRGSRMRDILMFWGGDERGSNPPIANQDFPVAIPIASQCLHAVGVATAFKYRKQNRIALCAIGDGATSQGDFYEAINLAGVWKLPVVFLVSNNQWAISVPRAAQSASQTLAQKAIAAGIDGVQVDGNDYIAMRDTLDQAIEKARSGNGATIIEALTYRLSDHTTADDASRYRSAEEVEVYKQKDPLLRLERHMRVAMGWDEGKQQSLKEQCQQQIEEEIQAYLTAEAAPPTEMFDYLYESLPKVYLKQRQQLFDEWQQHLGAREETVDTDVKESDHV